MTVKIKDRNLFNEYLSAITKGCIEGEDDAPALAHRFLNYIDDSHSVGDVKAVVNAIFDGEKVELDEQKYEIPLPNLVTSDGAQQYLSRRSLGSYFASRKMDIVCSEFTELELNTQVPKAYRQFAQKVED